MVRLDGPAVRLRAGNERWPKKRRPCVSYGLYTAGCAGNGRYRSQVGTLFRIETEDVRAKLVRISPSSVDRLQRKDRAALRVKGRSLTRPGALLKSRIPVRTFFHRDGCRKSLRDRQFRRALLRPDRGAGVAQPGPPPGQRKHRRNQNRATPTSIPHLLHQKK
jgi:hypothetical protein